MGTATDAAARIETNLTERQRVVLDLVARGLTNSEIAARLGISLDGAKWHVSEILMRLNVRSREEAAAHWHHYSRPTARAKRALAALIPTSRTVQSFAAVGTAVVLVAALALVFTLRDQGTAPPSTVDTPRPTLTSIPVTTPTPVPGEIAVIAHELEQVSSGGRNWTTVEVIGFDAENDRIVHRFQFGGPGEYSSIREVFLAGNLLVLNQETKVVVTDLSGANQSTIFEVGPSLRITTVAVSNDGRMVAIGTEDAEFIDISAGALTIVTIPDGTIVREMTAAELMDAGHPGWPAPYAWHASDDAVEVEAWTHKGSYFGRRFTTVGLDGSVAARSDYSALAISPSGATLALASDAIVCNGGVGSAPASILLIDLASGSEVGTIQLPERAVAYPRWSPDETEVLFVSQGLFVTPEGSTCAEGEFTWHLWDGMAVTNVDQPVNVLQRWYGDRHVYAACPPPGPDLQPWNADITCGISPDRNPTTPLRIDGTLIETVVTAVLVGYFQP